MMARDRYCFQVREGIVLVVVPTENLELSRMLRENVASFVIFFNHLNCFRTPVSKLYT